MPGHIQAAKGPTLTATGTTVQKTTTPPSPPTHHHRRLDHLYVQLQLHAMQFRLVATILFSVLK